MVPHYILVFEDGRMKKRYCLNEREKSYEDKCSKKERFLLSTHHQPEKRQVSHFGRVGEGHHLI